MITQLTQENITEYASDAQTIQEPIGTDYTQGVRVGKTVPAKWWNWLFNASTKRIAQSYNDANNMLTEMKNVVIDAGLTPSGTDNTQLSQAVTIKADAQIDAFLYDKSNVFERWQGQPVYVDGVELIPDGFYNGNIIDIHEADGVFFGVAQDMATTGSGAVENSFVYSYDLVHWIKTEIYVTITNNSIHTFNNGYYGVVHYNGYWYVFLYSASGSSGYITTEWRLWRSVDLHSWTQVASLESTGIYSQYVRRPFIAVYDSKLYLYTNLAANQEPTLRYTTDGSNWTTVSTAAPLTGELYRTGASAVVVDKFGDLETFWITYDTYALAAGKSLVGTVLVAEDNWSSVTVMDDAQSDCTRAIAPRIQHLRNGCTVIDRLVSYRYDTLYTIIIDASGNVVFKSDMTSTNTNLYSIERTTTKEYVLLGITTYTSESNYRHARVNFSGGYYEAGRVTEDGVTFWTFPIRNCDIVGTPDRFVVLQAFSPSSGSYRNLRVYTTQELTDDVSDYEVISDTPGIIQSSTYNIDRKCFRYGGEANAVIGIRGSSASQYFNGLYTPNFGQNWKRCSYSALYPTQVYNDVLPVQYALGGKLLCIESYDRNSGLITRTRISSTVRAVNQVMGHTLYLR
jgi:hypothetical protein